MAAKQPHSCEICGVDGLTEEEIRQHVMLFHLKDAVVCPFCHLSSLNAEEMLTHVNGAHLDYMTPEQEMLTYIDDDELTLRADEMDDTGGEEEDGGRSRLTDLWLSKKLGRATPGINNNNNNNNNVQIWEDGVKKSNGESSSWSSPQRKQLALNLSSNLVASTSLAAKFHQCLLCSYKAEAADLLEEHINRKHFDLTSPSIATAAAAAATSSTSPSRPTQYHLYSCPICAKTYENTPDLELHVNIEHKEILSPAKPCAGASRESNVNECPICCMTGFKTTDDLAQHIEEHFNPHVSSPLTPDVSCDRLLAKEMEKRDKEVQRLREQHEFELLRAQYGMDNEGNFKEQSLTNMQRAVYSGELTVADYYERQIELRMAESTGIDDGSSCTKDIVDHVAVVSNGSSNVDRTHLCTTVDHYASTYGDRGWGCGYRNTQMVISSLVHHTGFNEQLYKLWMLGPGFRPGVELPSRSTMPSISRLQQHIEWAWSQGFDTQGAEQLGSKVVNTRKWIGATEVVTILSSLRIRCRLVDFHRPTHVNGSHPELFKWVVDYFTALDDFKPPLYLQHQGHSRTIIGVELLRDGGVYLLLLDPIHTPSQMAALKNTATAHNALRLLRKPLFAMKARHYQIVAVAGIMDSEAEYQNSKILRSDRIPQEP